MQKLGVIGGLGPMTTSYFIKMVVEMTDAKTDQEHIEMIIYHCPDIPDRTSYILGTSQEDPVPKMAEAGRELARQKAGLIAIPCVTASCFYHRLREAVPVRIINAPQEICSYVSARGYQCVGLMATTGMVESGLFQQAFQSSGCRLALPSEERQKDLMHVIYENIKANRPVDMERFSAVAKELRQRGAQLLLLGCTELSIIRERHEIGAGYLDAMQLMAKCAVEACGRLREEYRELVTKGQEV